MIFWLQTWFNVNFFSQETGDPTFYPQEQDQHINYETSGNLQIPLANGNIMKIPLSSINISEEVNKTGIWQQVNESNEKQKTKMLK